MPYIMVDELPEGAEEAYVIDKNEYDAAVKARDELLDRAVKAEDGYAELQKKYTDAFLKSTSPVVQPQQPQPDTGAHSINELFS